MTERKIADAVQSGPPHPRRGSGPTFFRPAIHAAERGRGQSRVGPPKSAYGDLLVKFKQSRVEFSECRSSCIDKSNLAALYARLVDRLCSIEKKLILTKDMLRSASGEGLEEEQ